MKKLFMYTLLTFSLSSLNGCYWENFSKTERVEPLRLTAPNSIETLIDEVKSATQNGHRIRMTGSGHSHSDVAITEDILLRPIQLIDVLKIDRQRLYDPEEVQLVRVESGITVRKLNTYLDTQGLALSNMGGYDGQTIVGATMTGTHGSGLNHGPMASQIVSLQIVIDDGRVLQLEPSNGITNPDNFPGVLEENMDIDVELIQNDALFNAAKISIGSMGIVYSVVLKTDRKFWLDEVRILSTWEEVKAPGGFLDRLISGLPLDDTEVQPEYYELQYNPYKVGGERSILITKRYKFYEPLTIDTERGQPGTTKLSGLITLLEKPLIWIVDNFQFIAPILVEQSLKSQADDSYKNVSYKIFNIGIVNHTDAYAMEMGFDLNESIAAIERTFELGEELRDNGIVHSAPVSIRFVKAADELIAMQQGRDTMIIEFIMINGIKGDRELFNTYAQTLMEEFQARPHWGLDFKLLQGSEWASMLFPEWGQWIQHYETMNPNGTFDGRVTDRLGISRNPR